MKMERLVKRNTEMETCCNNIKLLTEMLNHYGPSSPAQDKELMKVHCSLFFLFFNLCTSFGSDKCFQKMHNVT